MLDNDNKHFSFFRTKQFYLYYLIFKNHYQMSLYSLEVKKKSVEIH